MLSNLLEVCREVVAAHPIDVAIVATSAASYAALQHQRREQLVDYFPDTTLADAMQRLGEGAQAGSLALFLGAGTSVPAGAPSWSQLITALAVDADFGPDVVASFEKLSPGPG